MTRRHFLGSAAAAAVSGKPQDLIIVLCDDLGYGDLGCFGHPSIQTPNLDAFARQGIADLTTTDRGVLVYHFAGFLSDAEKAVLDAVINSSVAIKEILELGDKLRKQKVRLREVVRDLPDEDDEPADAAASAPQPSSSAPASR